MSNKNSVISQDLLQEQLRFCGQINDYWKSRGVTPTAYVETYGCQQNEADSERIRGILSESGYAIVRQAENADADRVWKWITRHMNKDKTTDMR